MNEQVVSMVTEEKGAVIAPKKVKHMSIGKKIAVSECLAATCFIGNYAEFELLDGKHCNRQPKQEGNFVKSVSCDGLGVVHRQPLPH